MTDTKAAAPHRSAAILATLTPERIRAAFPGLLPAQERQSFMDAVLGRSVLPPGPIAGDPMPVVAATLAAAVIARRSDDVTAAEAVAIYHCVRDELRSAPDAD